MRKILWFASLCVAFLFGMLAARSQFGALPASAYPPRPSDGWTTHIDAEKHFGDAHPTEVAHHWCKGVADGMLECQIYDSDAADAHLVAVETIVQPAVYKGFDAQEQALWHYHRDEIPKVNAKIPDLPPDQAKKLADSLMDTYGKVWLLFDPLATNGLPTGQPTVVVLK